MLAGALVRPLASIVGRPDRALRGVTGRLARENTLRNPGRTATTSAALMIGVALVVFAAIFAASATKSVDDALDQTYVGDLTITNTDGFSPFSPEVGEAVARGRGRRDRLGGRRLRRADRPAERVRRRRSSPASTPTSPPSPSSTGWTATTPRSRAWRADEAIAESQWAEDNGIEVGDELTVTTQGGERARASTIAGTVRDEVQLLVPSLALPIETVRAEFDADQDFVDLVGFAPGADSGGDPRRRRRADRGPLPAGRGAVAGGARRTSRRSRSTSCSAIIYVLLALSIIISLFGVVNTLVLTIYERTREIGMLRAIGASRSQIRRMVRYESLITAMIGAIIGAAIGVADRGRRRAGARGRGPRPRDPGRRHRRRADRRRRSPGSSPGSGRPARASKIEVMEALQYE